MFLALAVLGGCANGGFEVRKVAFTLPAGWVKAESEDKSVSIAVPPGFRYGANNMFGTTNPFEGLASNESSAPAMNPEDKNAMESLAKGLSEGVKEDEMRNLDKLAMKGIILKCISTGKPVIGEELTRFYVKRKSQSINWTWPDVDASEQDCFKEKQKAKEVKLPIGLAHRMQATGQQIDGSNYTQISSLVPKGNELYVLRFITVEQPEVITAHEKEVADTLRIN